MRSASPKLKDVANQAGVAIGTASSALNNRLNVSPDTRARVMDAALSLGYPLKQRNADTITTSLSVIGLLLKREPGEEWLNNPFYSHVQMGVTNACLQHRISLMLASIELDNESRPLAWPTMISERQVDGLILSGAYASDVIKMIQQKLNIPIVLIDGQASDYSCDSIVIDNFDGALKAVDYLIEQGHERIGLLGWNTSSAPESVMQRYWGYRQAIERAGYPLFVAPSALSRFGGSQGVKELLTRCPEVTAIFCCNDDTAIGAMAGAQEMGRCIPDDLSIIGFDDIELSGEIKPALTTIHVYKSWMGAMGVQSLIGRVRNPEQPRVRMVLSTYLVERESVSHPTRQTTDVHKEVAEDK